MPRPRVLHQFTDGIEEKHCKTCNTWKELLHFSTQNKTWDKLDTQCRQCSSDKYKKRAETKKNGVQKKAKAKIFEWVKANWQAINDYSKVMSQDAQRSEYLLDATCKKYVLNKGNARRRAFRNNSVDEQFKSGFRAFMSRLTNGQATEDSKHVEFLGCTLDYFRRYIEIQFAEGMSWENRGMWHIDHIIPCSYFDLSTKRNQLICSNYRNLTPVWGPDNIAKSDVVTVRAKALLFELESLRIGGSNEKVKEREKAPEFSRREKIAKGVADFNKTEAGKERKRIAIQKAAETKARNRKELRKALVDKTCKHCERCLPVSEFNSKESAKDGLQTNCKTCVNKIKRERR